ncbi:6621_t:CDS:10 [Ambispora gerdemannii]|uniref:6621_t:CDS:1 n=1 Tax=Ambispora gerdemannii TaxID=144530 RepID=A0A9N9AUD1_9GLOM|nr:6621_t:CDS:10 [Ambispora gerdemannii]
MNLVEIDEVSVIAAILGGFIVIFGFVSLLIKERLYLSEALVSALVGIIVGPVALRILVPERWSDQEQLAKITMQFTRIVVAIQVMAAGISLPKGYLIKEAKSIFCLLVPVMGYMWIASGLFIWLLIPSINFLEALVISASVTPTDPILANSVVKGKFAEKHVPPHVRNVLSAESGANDGFNVPFLFIAIYLMTEKTGDAIAKWIYVVWIYKILLSCLIGLVVGYVARKLLYLAETKRLIDKESFLAFAIALTLFLLGTVSIIGSNEVLACFIAGNSVTWDDWFRKETEESHFQEVIDMLLNMAVFVYVGVTIPWSSFSDPALGLAPWRLIVLGVLILLFRRLPIMLLLYRWIPAIKTYREAVFSGWFGPIGISSIFYASFTDEFLAKHGGSERSRELVLPVVYFIVCTSILVHGCTIPVFKISQRINTRTLTTTSFTNQVSRLPILRFGQELRFSAPKTQQETSPTKDVVIPEEPSDSTTTIATSHSGQKVVSETSSTDDKKQTEDSGGERTPQLPQPVVSPSTTDNNTLETIIRVIPRDPQAQARILPPSEENRWYSIIRYLFGSHHSSHEQPQQPSDHEKK